MLSSLEELVCSRILTAKRAHEDRYFTREWRVLLNKSWRAYLTFTEIRRLRKLARHNIPQERFKTSWSILRLLLNRKRKKSKRHSPEQFW